MSNKVTKDDFPVGLVLSGGGVKGLCILGALHHYIESDKIDVSKIKEFVGSSIGSVLCLLLICGYSTSEILDIIINMDRDMFSQSPFSSGLKHGLADILANCGALTIDNFINHISMLMKQRGWNTVPTLKTFYERTGKLLIVTGVNVTKYQVEYHSAFTSPDLLVTDAIKISCNIPFVFKQIRYQNCLHVDGGLLNNLAVDAIDDGKKKILAIQVTGIKPVNVDQSIPSYVFSLITMPILSLSRLRLEQCGPNVETLDIFGIPPPEEKVETNLEEKSVVKKEDGIDDAFGIVSLMKSSSLFSGLKDMVGFSPDREKKYSLFLVGYLQASTFVRPKYLTLKI